MCILCRDAVSDRTGILVLRNTALNVVCNQEYAQAVPHVCSMYFLPRARLLMRAKVHYHIIPAPRPNSPSPLEDMAKVDHVVKPLTQNEMHKLEFESRTILEDDDAEKLAKQIRARL